VFEAEGDFDIRYGRKSRRTANSKKDKSRK
jgi:hypothetical protein